MATVNAVDGTSLKSLRGAAVAYADLSRRDFLERTAHAALLAGIASTFPVGKLLPQLIRPQDSAGRARPPLNVKDHGALGNVRPTTPHPSLPH